MRLSLLLWGPVLLLATLGFAQQQAQPPPASPPYTTPPTFPEEPQLPPDQKAPPPQALSTTQVELQIREHFNAEPELANSNVQIKADESSVVLSGTVASDVQHALALRIAQSYAGDRKIVDKITVRQQT
jgi:Flp pilus assembly secretin CpaC